MQKSIFRYKQEEMNRNDRCYLRCYLAVEKAIQLNTKIYGDKRTKDNTQFRFEHSVRVAGLTQEIKSQSIVDYHLTWIVGILHDALEDDPKQYNQDIDFVLDQLRPDEQKFVKKCIQQLTPNPDKSKLSQRTLQISIMDNLSIIPSWVKVFDKYDNCLRFKKNSAGKSKEELRAYYSVCYLIYQRACINHLSIKNNCPPQVKKFFEELKQQLGGQSNKIQKIVEQFYGKHSLQQNSKMKLSEVKLKW